VGDGARQFRIIHPFHPLHDQEVELVTVRQNWGEDLLYYHDSQGRLCSIPAAWTDHVPADPVVVVSAGRSPFRLQDLIELGRLIQALQQEAGEAPRQEVSHA
jgi:hypothetical protein